mgnify:FL=1
MKLKTLILTIFAFWISNCVSGQNINDKLNRLTSLTLKDKDYVSNEESGLMSDVINYILETQHEEGYKAYYVPYEFDTTRAFGSLVFYKTANITTSKKLFYWCYNQKDEWIINSKILDSLDNTSADYELRVFENNGTDILVFNSHETNFLTTSPIKKWQRIDYFFDSLQYFTHVYVNCQVMKGKIIWGSKKTQNMNQLGSESDSLLTLLRTKDFDYEQRVKILNQLDSLDKKHESQHGGKQTIYLTRLYTSDINTDKNLEYYWCAVSNGRIVFHSAYAYRNGRFLEITDEIESRQLIEQNQDITEMIKVSKE